MNKLNMFTSMTLLYTYMIHHYSNDVCITSCIFGEDKLKLKDIKIYPNYYYFEYSDRSNNDMFRFVVSDINEQIVNKIRFNKSTIEKNLNLILVNDNVEL